MLSALQEHIKDQGPASSYVLKNEGTSASQLSTDLRSHMTACHLDIRLQYLAMVDTPSFSG